MDFSSTPWMHGQTISACVLIQLSSVLSSKLPTAKMTSQTVFSTVRYAKLFQAQSMSFEALPF